MGLHEGLALSLMGTWDYRESNVPLLDAFSRLAAGWAEVEPVGGTRSVLIAPAPGGKICRLGAGNEYFLVENRGANGPYDTNIGRPGLAVYHVNLERRPSAAPDSYLRTVIDCPNCRRWRPLVMNIQADRRYDLQFRTRSFEADDLFHSGDALLPAPSALRLSPSNVWFSSNFYSGRPSGVSITEIDSASVLPFIRATLHAPPLNEAQAGLLFSGPGAAGSAADRGP